MAFLFTWGTQAHVYIESLGRLLHDKLGCDFSSASFGPCYYYYLVFYLDSHLVALILWLRSCGIRVGWGGNASYSPNYKEPSSHAILSLYLHNYFKVISMICPHFQSYSQRANPFMEHLVRALKPAINFQAYAHWLLFLFVWHPSSHSSAITHTKQYFICSEVAWTAAGPFS